MKRINLFVLLFLSIVYYACDQQPSQHWDISDLREVQEKVYGRDSIIDYISGNQYLCKTEFVYDSLDRKREIIYSQRNGMEWEQASRVTIDPADSGTETIYTVYHADGEEWMPASRNRTVEEKEKSKLTDEVFVWENNQWVKSAYSVSFYDTLNNRIDWERYEADGNRWEKKEKKSNRFDGQVLSETYRVENNQWVKNNKATIVYDSLTRTKVEKFYTGEGDDWKLTRRDVSLYDANDNRIQYEKYAIHDNKETKKQKILSTYDANNLLVNQDFYSNIGGEWEPDQRTTSAYDADGNLLETADYDIVNKEEIKNVKETFVLDKNKNLIRKEFYYRDDKYEWILMKKKEYAYMPSSHEVVEKNFTKTPDGWTEDKDSKCYLLDEDNKVKGLISYEKNNGTRKENDRLLHAILPGKKELVVYLDAVTRRGNEEPVSWFFFQKMQGDNLLFSNSGSNQGDKSERDRQVLIYDEDGRLRFEGHYQLDQGVWKSN